VHSKLPDRDNLSATLNSGALDDEMRDFLHAFFIRLDYMAATNIFSDFSDEYSIDSRSLSEDMLNFSFYTCYCFQWTLFENFIKKMVGKLVDARVVSPIVRDEVGKRWNKTKQLLDYIESGEVFGRTPFVTVLPASGWISTTETCDYHDLNRIRELRNDFIHAVESPQITPDNIATKYRKYERSMWILRNFASNTQQDNQRLLE
jgi:hypothetical protein